MRVLSLDPETIVFPSGEKATERIPELWALLFSVTSSSVAANEAVRVSFERDERFRTQRSPEFHTLRVLSTEPETMVFPSGEKATERISLLWAFVFSL